MKNDEERARAVADRHEASGALSTRTKKKLTQRT